MRRRPWWPFFLIPTLLACAGPPPGSLLIHDVEIVRLDPPRLLQGHSVLIEDGVIRQVAPDGSLRARAETVVDGGGRYLIPGLTDTHVHIDHPDELNLYPAYGVTGIFVLRGLPQHLEWRAEIQSGSRFGPRLFATGDYMDGYPPFMQPMLSFEGTDDVRRSVRRQTEAGYDFVKVYTRLTAEQLTAILSEADELGQCVVGHGGRDYPLAHLVRGGQANLAHGQDLIRWYFDGADDPEGIPGVVRDLAGSATTVTPNLSFTEGLIRQGENLEALLAQPEARYLHPAVLQPFRRTNNRYVRNADEWLDDVRARLEVEKSLALALYRAGVTLMAGTDASTAGVFPGESLHRELELLVAAGLTPAEALGTATEAPGTFLRRCVDAQLRVGRIAEGHRADLVLLENNPLENISAVREVAGVVLDGRWHPRAALQQRLEALDASYEGLREGIEALEKDLFAGNIEAAREGFAALRAERPGEILFSQYVPFFVGYGFLYGESGYSEDPRRLAAALGLYELYAETYPDRHSAHYQLGLAQEANALAAQAAASFRRALAIHPEYPDARRALARVEGKTEGP